MSSTIQLGFRKYVDVIIIASIALIAGIIIFYIFKSDVIIGAYLAGIAGIFIVYVTKYVEAERTKKYTSRAISSEIQINQEQVKILRDLHQMIVNVKEELKASEIPRFLEEGDISSSDNFLQ